MGFSVTLLTPERVVTQQPEVAWLHLPGEDGELDILVGHTPLIIALKAGVVSLHQENEKSIDEAYFFIWGGLANIRNEGVTLLVPRVCLLRELDQAALEKQAYTLMSSRAPDEESLLLVQAQLDALARYDTDV